MLWLIVAPITARIRLTSSSALHCTASQEYTNRLFPFRISSQKPLAPRHLATQQTCLSEDNQTLLDVVSESPLAVSIRPSGRPQSVNRVVATHLPHGLAYCAVTLFGSTSKRTTERLAELRLCAYVSSSIGLRRSRCGAARTVAWTR
jgi:hypothetical protein